MLLNTWRRRRADRHPPAPRPCRARLRPACPTRPAPPRRPGPAGPRSGIGRWSDVPTRYGRLAFRTC
ncbi:hypothetical protein GBW32_15680 [Streptomyces tsukubensis]|nr:hypothetical protein GBW32_15680 [Streptomyces tsukubensis]